MRTRTRKMRRRTTRLSGTSAALRWRRVAVLHLRTQSAGTATASWIIPAFPWSTVASTACEKLASLRREALQTPTWLQSLLHSRLQMTPELEGRHHRISLQPKPGWRWKPPCRHVGQLVFAWRGVALSLRVPQQKCGRLARWEHVRILLEVSPRWWCSSSYLACRSAAQDRHQGEKPQMPQLLRLLPGHPG